MSWSGKAVFEPIVQLQTGEVVGREALYRPVRGHGMPRLKLHWRVWYAHFARSIAPQAFESAQGWISINLHPWQIADTWIHGTISTLAMTYGSRLVIEWTEAPGTTVDQAARWLERLRGEYGIHIAIDDAGAGTDALERIVRVRPDIVKIDGFLFRRARTDRFARAAAEGLVDLSKLVGAKVIIEHVETPEDKDLAERLGADFGQGWHWPHAAG